MATNKFNELKDSVFFEIIGEDKNKFLQGLITNDIDKCLKNQAIYSAFLTPQGKFIADFFIVNHDNSFLFETNKKLIKELINKVNFYKLRSNIKIVMNNNYRSIAIYNKKNLFLKLMKPGDLEIENNNYIFIDSRKIEMGLKAFVLKKSFNDFCQKYSLSKDDSDNYKEHRIKNLIPDSCSDLEINKSVLLENNFDSINAIDWNKGCYVGQEITARMKYRSLLKKSLTKFLIVDGIVKPKDEIYYENKKIGNICSVGNKIGLALLRIDESKKAHQRNDHLKSNCGKIKIMF